MKIVFIEFAGKGGMIHYAYQLARGLQQEGADVTLLTEKEHYELAALEHPFRVDRFIETWDPKPTGKQIAPWLRKIRRIGRAFRYYREWLRVAKRVEELAPDLVLLGDIRFPFDLFPLMILRRKARRFADICHNVRPYDTGGGFSRSRLRQFFYRRIYRLFDIVFVHFERNRAELMASFGIPLERTGVIVHGNEEIFRELRTPGVDGAAMRRRLGIGDHERVVLFFGTLSWYKGIDVLLQSFRRVANARLVIAGFAFHDFDLEAHRKLAGENVLWAPEYIDSGDVAGWMEMADAIVFPYRDIYQSGALHVAQTFGVPIVASAIGAMKDVIEHEVSGLLVTPEDPEALAAALNRILDDRELAQRLGARAAQDAQGRFSWRTQARAILGSAGVRAG